jgi:hypothetical protein
MKTRLLLAVWALGVGTIQGGTEPQKFPAGTRVDLTNKMGLVYAGADLIQADKDGLLLKLGSGWERVAWTNVAAGDVDRLKIHWLAWQTHDREADAERAEAAKKWARAQKLRGQAEAEEKAIDQVVILVFTKWKLIGEERLELTCAPEFRLLDLDKRKLATAAAIVRLSQGRAKRVTFLDGRTGKELGSYGALGWKFSE